MIHLFLCKLCVVGRIMHLIDALFLCEFTHAKPFVSMDMTTMLVKSPRPVIVEKYILLLIKLLVKSVRFLLRSNSLG